MVFGFAFFTAVGVENDPFDNAGALAQFTGAAVEVFAA
jgi:hypothetical protein